MKNKSILLIALLLILASVFYSALWPEAPITVEDTRGYLPVAADLADGHLEKLHLRTLGYPLILKA